MTKKVRIENADTSSYGVIVEVWDEVTVDGVIKHVLTKTIDLNYPTQITGDECYITASRYLVVKEKPAA